MLIAISFHLDVVSFPPFGVDVEGIHVFFNNRSIQSVCQAAVSFNFVNNSFAYRNPSWVASEPVYCISAQPVKKLHGPTHHCSDTHRSEPCQVRSLLLCQIWKPIGNVRGGRYLGNVGILSKWTERHWVHHRSQNLDSSLMHPTWPTFPLVHRSSLVHSTKASIDRGRYLPGSRASMV